MMGFDFEVIADSAGYLFREGLTFTLQLTAVAASVGLLLGTVLAAMRNSQSRLLYWIATTYVTLFRSLPLVLVIFWFFFLVPFLVQWATGSIRPVAIGASWSAYITFSLFEAAYFSEIIRSGLNSVSRGQLNAGKALGLNKFQVFIYIHLPPAIRNTIPLILNQVIILFQDTSLVYVISITDFLGAASKIAQRDGRLTEMYVFCAVTYFIISFVASQLVKQLEKRPSDA